MKSIKPATEMFSKFADNGTSWLNYVGSVIALAVIAVYAFTVVAPYFVNTNTDALQLIDRNKGTVDTITVMVVSFFFGATYARSKDQDSINLLAKAASPESTSTTTVVSTQTEHNLEQ